MFHVWLYNLVWILFEKYMSQLKNIMYTEGRQEKVFCTLCVFSAVQNELLNHHVWKVICNLKNQDWFKKMWLCQKMMCNCFKLLKLLFITVKTTRESNFIVRSKLLHHPLSFLTNIYTTQFFVCLFVCNIRTWCVFLSNFRNNQALAIFIVIHKCKLQPNLYE